MSNFTYSDELYHHGIKGQKWGVRRYQNPDGSLTPEGMERYLKKTGGVYLKKGTVVQRVSDVDEDFTGKSGHKHSYVSFLEEDKFKYAKYSRSLGGTKFTMDTPYGYQIDLVVKDDIAAPGLEDQVKAAVENVQNMSVKEIDKHLIDKKGYSASSIYKDGEDFVHDMLASNPDGTVSELQKRAYLHYSRNLMKDKKLREDFFNNLSKKGYNAVIDYNDTTQSFIGADGKTKSMQGFASKPLILFDTQKSVDKMASRKITEQSLYDQAKKLHDKNASEAAVKNLAGFVGSVLAVAPTAFVSPSLAMMLGVYAVPLGSVLPGSMNSDKAMNYSADMQRYKSLMNLQKNDPVAYKKLIKDQIDLVTQMKEAEKKAEKKSSKTTK